MQGNTIVKILLGRSGQNWVCIQLWRPVKSTPFERMRRLHRRYCCLKTTQTSVLYENNFSYISLFFPRVVYDSVFECSNTGSVGPNPTRVMQTCVHFPPAFVVLCRWIPSPSRTYSVTARMYPCKHNSRILFTRMYSVIGLHYKITLLQYVSPDRFLLPLFSEFLSLVYEKCRTIGTTSPAFILRRKAITVSLVAGSD